MASLKKVGSKQKVAAFLKPTGAKSLLSIFFLLLFAFLMVYASYVRLPPLVLLFVLPLVLSGYFGLVLVFPYSYLLSCAVMSLFDFIKSRRLLLIAAIFILVISLGIDEPIVNSTVNRPDYSCSADSDCVIESISKGGCGNKHCVNGNWKYYDAAVYSVFAVSCSSPLYSCSCVDNKCKSRDISKSTNLDDCKNYEGNMKKECDRVILNNKNDELNQQYLAKSNPG